MLSAKKRYWIEIVVHLAFWVGVFYTLNSLTSSHIQVRVDTNGMVTERSEKQVISPFTFLTVGFLAMLFYGNIFWIFRKIIQYKNGLVRLAISVGWFMIIFAANYFIVGLFLDHTSPAIHSFQNLAFRSFGPHLPPHINTANIRVDNWLHMQLVMLLIFLAVLGISIAYFFLKEWARSELVQNQLEAYQLSTEIKFLKSQINPHFLFNTLNNLFSMAQGKGNDDLADGISKLSGMMRYMIYESNAEYVPLKKEIEYLQNCIVLNKLRYADDEIKVNFNYPSQTEDLVIAPMLFISFVENAFKHGVSIGRPSQIDISISVIENQLTFSCQNTIYSFIKMDDNKGIGLENIKRRLELVYPGKYILAIKNDDNKYIVELKIDLA